MYNIFRPIFSTALFLIGAAGIIVSAQVKVRFHNESEDTTRINELLIECQKIKTPGEKVKAMAFSFEGTPYVGHTL